MKNLHSNHVNPNLWLVLHVVDDDKNHLMTDSHLTKVIQKVPEAGTADKGVLCALPSATANSQLEQSCRKKKQTNKKLTHGCAC